MEISENGLIYFVGLGLDRVFYDNKEYFQSIIIPSIPEFIILSSSESAWLQKYRYN